MNRKSFDNHYFYKISQLIYWALLHNLSFTLINLPLFLSISLVPFSFKNIFLYTLTSLTFFPSLFLLLHSVNTFDRLQLLPTPKEYLTTLFQSIKKALPFSFITNLLFFVVYTSINYTIKTEQLKFFPPIYLLLFFFVFGISLTYLYFSIRNPFQPTIVLLKTAFYFSIQKIYLTFINTILISCFLVLLFIKPILSFFLLPSIVAIILFKNSTLFMTSGNRP
ncbi:hypothetical protein J2Z51_000956 [Enterococcus alcedinis]|nr:hypothetical protein [Enterococcus alcedinis]